MVFNIKYKILLPVAILMIALCITNKNSHYASRSLSVGRLHGEIGIETDWTWLTMSGLVWGWCELKTSCCVAGVAAMSVAASYGNFIMDSADTSTSELL